MTTNTNLATDTSSREGILADVRQIVAGYTTVAPAEIEEAQDLINDLGCDSLDIVEITMEVEEHFDITVPDEQGQDVRTVGDIVDGVRQLLGQTHAEPA